MQISKMHATQLCLSREKTPLGTALLVTDDQGVLLAFDWEDCEPRMLRLVRRWHSCTAHDLSEVATPRPLRAGLSRYFSGDLTALDSVPRRISGTAFQRETYRALCLIPVGETRSYGALASQIGKPTAARAVGLANGANPIGLFVPCHRVIGADGSLTGYAGGLVRKRWLLAHEGC